MKRFSLLLAVLFLGLVFTGVRAKTTDTTATQDTAVATMTDAERLNKFKLDSMELSLKSQYKMSLIQDSPNQNQTTDVIGVFIPIVMFLCGAFVLYLVIDSKKKVRLAMIEKGMDPSVLDQPTDESSRKYTALRFGLLLAGVGFGLLTGWTVSDGLGLSEDSQALVVIASALTFGGLGLVAYHLIANKIEKK